MPDETHAAHDVEDFLTAFNRIERELKRRTGVPEHEGFKTAAHRFVERHAWWRRDFEAILAFSDLRNVIVHDRFDRFGYLSVPSREVLDEIAAIERRLLRPVRADAAFARDVVAVDVGDALASVLARIRDRAFTQFPVYEDGTFRGLVTAAGLAHWLAQQTRDADDARIDFARRTAGELLAFESGADAWSFAARDLPAVEVVERFVERPGLAAVLITEHGREDQGLLGIATPSDAAAWRERGD